MIELARELDELRPRISVVGVGGGGGNAVANMIGCGVRGVDFVLANTDAQALRTVPGARIVQLGRHTTQGLGAGSNAELGRAAAEESLDDIVRMLDGADMCFVAAGMGGGTGTGAAPVIADAARSRGILTVGVVTKPFAFEGARRARIAEAGLAELHSRVDTLIVIPNQNLFRIANRDTTFKEAFAMADEVLQQGVRGITDLMVMPGLINLDFADLRTIMADMGKAMMGTGEAGGERRAARAAEAAIANPLLDEAVKGARGLVISITGGEDMGLMEVDEAAGLIKALVDSEAEIIWGAAFDPALTGRLRVSVVATGIDPPVAAAVRAEPEAEVEVALAAVIPIEQAVSIAPGPAYPVEICKAPPPADPIEVCRAPAPPRARVQEELLLTRAAGPRPLARVGRPLEPEMIGPPARGPSLMERMADAARVAVRRRGSEAPCSLVAAE